MKHPEAKHKSTLVKEAKAMGAYARRFEDQFAVGLLDCFVAFAGLPPCFIEGKMILGRTFSPTERQYIEGMRIIKANSSVMPVLVGWSIDNNVMYVGGWHITARMDDCVQQLPGQNYAQTLERYLSQWRTT